MREFLVMGLLLITSTILNLFHTRIAGIVVYDKIVHLTIGILFGIIYFSNFPKDRPWLIAALFAVVYEIFVYLIFSIFISLIAHGFVIFHDFYLQFVIVIFKYSDIDEWFDVIASFLGVLCSKVIIKEDDKFSSITS